jgi:hypothetical protein
MAHAPGGDRRRRRNRIARLVVGGPLVVLVVTALVSVSSSPAVLGAPCRRPNPHNPHCATPTPTTSGTSGVPSPTASLSPTPSPSLTPSPSPTTPSPTPSRAPTPTASPSPTGGSDPVIAAAGDISCPGVCGQAATARLVTAMQPRAVLGLGDYQYDTGTLANFAAYYGPYWGAFKSRTYAINGGSHDFYGTGDYLTYFNNGGPTTLKPEGSYSFDVGAWHLIALNSYCFERSTCDPAAVTAWLKSDLAAHPSACTLAYFHEPYWTTPSEHGRDTSTRAWVQALYDAGADVLLQAHNHSYERFAPQRPDDVPDAQQGLTSFVVGTGGRSHYAFSGSPAANSVVRNDDTYGVLQLTLHPTSAEFRFVPEAGKTFTDAGTVNCH